MSQNRRGWFKGRGGGNGGGGGGGGGGRRGRHQGPPPMIVQDSPEGSGCFPPRNKYRLNKPAGNLLNRLGLPIRRFEDRKAVNVQRTIPGAQRGENWYKVQIPKGESFGRDFLFRSIENYVEKSLCPILFQFTAAGEATFYLDDQDLAEALSACSRRISAPSGGKVVINVSKCPPPLTPLKPEDENMLKAVLSRRFNPDIRHIDMSQLGQEPGVAEHGAYFSLQRNNVMFACVKLLGQLGFELKSVDLSGNRLRFLDYFAALVPRQPGVERLSLRNNQIETEKELAKLSGWPLVQLDLEGCPFSANFRDRALYVSVVRKLFPKLTRLDGIELPPQLGFELEAPADQKLPGSRPSFFVNEEVKQLVERFVHEYYQVYDGGDRQRLLEAYDDEAMLTMTAGLVDEDARRGPLWGEYIRDSHNILNSSMWERFRSKLVQKGRLAVVGFLQKMPETRHDIQAVDVSFLTNELLCFTVTGVMRETNTPEFPRYFSRVFLVVPRGSGISVVNDELFVTPLSQEQIRKIERDLSAAVNLTAMPPALPQSVALPLEPVLQPTSQTTSESREGLIARFATESGMRADWAEKCLADNGWDFQRAAHVFQELRKLGGIPPDAFS